MASLILFGPQRMGPSLRPEFDRLMVDGQVAVISAGWQEREGEIDELRQHLGRPVVDLKLHARSEQVFTKDRDLAHAHRARQDRLQAWQQIYRYRLDFVLEPARELMRRGGDEPDILDRARDSAIDAICQLDRDHLQRLADEHDVYQREWRPKHRLAVVEQREQLAEILERSSAVAIAGGHVAVLLNRMRLFDMPSLFGNLPIFAWSAGAMALGERVVLFHDSPPQGAGNPEVLDTGLGLYRGLIVLPHAHQRLRLQDPVRVSLFARRFAPDTCVPLDEGMSVRRGERGFGWEPGVGTLQLRTDGRIEPLGA